LVQWSYPGFTLSWLCFVLALLLLCFCFARLAINLEVPAPHHSSLTPCLSTAAEGVLEFAEGEAVKFIDIVIIDDDVLEPDEYFTVKLRNVRALGGSSVAWFSLELLQANMASMGKIVACKVVILNDDEATTFRERVRLELGC